MKRMGKYLYAIIGGSGDRTYGPIGINGGVVHTLKRRLPMPVPEMKRYTVKLTASAVVHTRVEVEAESSEAAAQAALSTAKQADVLWRYSGARGDAEVIGVSRIV
mgnify:FL=1